MGACGDMTAVTRARYFSNSIKTKLELYSGLFGGYSPSVVPEALG